MALNPDTDPMIVAARERGRAIGRAQGLAFSRKLNAALERMKTTMAQNTHSPSNPNGETTQTKASASNGNDNAEGVTDTAIQEIEAPLELSAGDIVETVEQDGRTIVHNVMDGERVLFSTLSKPLAFAFIQGHNTAAKAQRTGETEKDSSDSGEERKATRRSPAVPGSQSGDSPKAAGAKAERADPDNNPAPVKPKADNPIPGSQSGGQDGGEDRKDRKADADAAPRKRAVL